MSVRGRRVSLEWHDCVCSISFHFWIDDDIVRFFWVRARDKAWWIVLWHAVIVPNEKCGMTFGSCWCRKLSVQKKLTMPNARLIQWVFSWHYLDKFRNQDADVKSFHSLIARVSSTHLRCCWMTLHFSGFRRNVFRENCAVFLNHCHPSVSVASDACAHVFRIQIISFRSGTKNSSVKLQLQLYRNYAQTARTLRPRCLLKF